MRTLGGEPRARHVYTRPGAADDVAAAWRSVLGDGFTVTTQAEIVASGWFGPHVSSPARARIGDVVVVANGDSAVIRSGAEPMQSRLIGHHGSLTSAEMMVPLCTYYEPG